MSVLSEDNCSGKMNRISGRNQDPEDWSFRIDRKTSTYVSIRILINFNQDRDCKNSDFPVQMKRS